MSAYIDAVSPFGMVKNAFDQEGIDLHIDTGWKEGYGGDEIDDIPYYLSIDTRTGPNNDFYDFKWGNGWSLDEEENNVIGPNRDNFFNPNRYGIFHYCIIGAKIFYHRIYSGITPFEKNTKTVDGDDFLISHSNVRKNSDNHKGFAATFMHELGHNLGLVPYNYKPFAFEGIDLYD